MAASTELGAAGAPGAVGPPEPVAVAGGWHRNLRLPRSPKVIFGLISLGFFLVIAVIGPWIAPFPPGASLSTTTGVPQPPSAAHWLGTTQVQQDVLSQLLVGGRSMLLVAFLSGAVATVLSVVIGVTAGYLGGYADDLLSMLANFFLVLPALPLLIVIFGFLPASQGSNDLLIGLIIAFEILPNLLPIVASSLLFTVLYAVGTYTAMAFLGLVNPTHWNWGTMLFWAQSANAEVSGYWWWWLPPGLAVAFLGTSLALLNFGIDEFINPRLRAAGLTRKRVKKYAVGPVPRRFKLGVTPVVRLREGGQP